MKRQLRTLGIVVTAALLLASCGDNDKTIIIDDNDNTDTRTATPVVTPTSVEETPTGVVPTATPGPEATATPVATGPTATPGPGATATPVVTGPTATPGLGATATPAPVATATHTPTPTPTATVAAAPLCGNGNLDAGEECDTGATFGLGGCAGECACCLCRTSHLTPGSSCSTCHPAVVTIPAFPAGAAETFPGLCE